MNHKRNSIQALRGIAFIAVFFYHAGIEPSGGIWGVSIFFILSGFLLENNNYDRALLLTDNNLDFFIASVKYSVSHIKKLYVLHQVMTLAAFPLLVVRMRGQTHVAANIFFRVVANVLLVQAWFPWPSICYSMNNLSWFLSCMTFLYFMYPAIHRGLSRIKYRGKLKIGFIGCIIFLMLMVGVLVHELCLFYGADDWIVQGLTYNFPIYRLGDFLIGCILGGVYRETRRKLSNSIYTFVELLALIMSGIIVFQIGIKFFIPATFCGSCRQRVYFRFAL